MAVLGGILLISHLAMLQYFPDHPSNTYQDRHPMAKSKSIERESLQQQQQLQHPRGANSLNMDDPHQQQQQQQQPNKQQQPRKRKKLRILANEKRKVKPTANTVSPYLKHPLFAGKERLLTMLHEAHYFNDSAPEFFQDKVKVEALASQLPLWETITHRLGGEKPALEGLDTCSKFQSLVPPEERFIGVAGLFATGTNLLASLLVANCQNKARIEKYNGGTGVRWQVNWGKHTPARYRLDNRLDPKLNNEHYLPVVTIRHPYSWMQSMCRQRYSTHWFHNAQEHCPNLVPNEIDHKWYNYTVKYGKRGINHLFNDPWLRDNLLDLANYTLNRTVVPVRVRYKSGTQFHESLAHLWNDWYKEYMVDADFPRIVVRLEDLVFHAKEVVTQICSCIGGTVVDDFRYVSETAKVGDDNIHGKDRTNLFKWFTKWHLEDRTKNMTKEDRAYAREHLDPDLLKKFQYEHPEAEG